MFKKQLSWLLLVVLVFSFIFAGCSNDKDEKKDASTNTAASTKATKTLRQLADDNGMLVTAAVEPKYLKEKEYADTLKREFNGITPENALKWEVIRKTKDTFDFSGADEIMKFAEENKMKVRGHNLAWHVANPEWLDKGPWTKDSLLALLKDHITKVVDRYKGKIYAWDVCNEVVSDAIPYTLRDTVWSRTIGPEYIEKAFQWAHEADPNAKLILNEFGMEEKNAKADYFYELVKGLKAKGVPIDGVGFQFHIDIENIPDMASVYENVKRFADLGLLVDFTEVDVRINSEVNAAILKKQAQVYSDLMRIALSFDSSKVYAMWGMTDKYSWIPKSYPNSSSGHIFSDDYKPKPAYDALVKDLGNGRKGANFDQRIKELAASRNIIPAFKCNPAKKAPVIDGSTGSDEWKDAVVYRFAYNQLDSDTRPPKDLKNFYGEWRVLYDKNTLYGLINREDDVTTTDQGSTYQNDCIELFMEENGVFNQLRSVVGQNGWEDNPMQGKRTVKWSKDGKVCEFSIEMTQSDLTGSTIGWNIALTDNDASAQRSRQVYPFPGSNQSYTGKDLGALTFISDTPKPVDKNRIVPPFMARKPWVAPKVDGVIDEGEYSMAYQYIFAYNQLDTMNQCAPKDLKDIYGDWRIFFDGNKIYGAVTRQDDKTVTDKTDPLLNDNIELVFKIDGKVSKFVSVIGKDFEKNDSGMNAKAVWNSDGTVMEFTIELPIADLSEQSVGFNISLTDNDGGDKIKWKLYPIPGDCSGDDTKSLSDLYFSVV